MDPTDEPLALDKVSLGDTPNLAGLFSLPEERIAELAGQYKIALNPFENRIDRTVSLILAAQEQGQLTELLKIVPESQGLSRGTVSYIRLRHPEFLRDYMPHLHTADDHRALALMSRYIRSTTSDAVALQNEIGSLRQQVQELEQQQLTGEQMSSSLQQIVGLIDNVAKQSADLTANLILPPQSVTDVPLVPVHLLERYEEYKSDENIAFLLIGLFAGAALSVLVNWATNDSFQPNPMSTTLLILFALLSLLFVGLARRVKIREKKVSDIFSQKDSASQ